jgi:hypothetical protein
VLLRRSLTSLLLGLLSALPLARLHGLTSHLVVVAPDTLPARTPILPRLRLPPAAATRKL